MKGAIGRGGIAPVLGNLKKEGAWIDSSTFGIRIEAVADHCALHEIGIHIARSQGTGKYKGSDPGKEDALDIA